VFALLAVTYNQSLIKQGNFDTETSRKSYIIMFKDDITPEALAKIEERLISAGGQITHRYTTVFKGCAVSIPEDAVMAMEDDPSIYSIEADQQVHTYTN